MIRCQSCFKPTRRVGPVVPMAATQCAACRRAGVPATRTYILDTTAGSQIGQLTIRVQEESTCGN